MLFKPLKKISHLMHDCFLASAWKKFFQHSFHQEKLSFITNRAPLLFGRLNYTTFFTCPKPFGGLVFGSNTALTVQLLKDLL